MYAVIRTGGKQYKVAEGDVLNVERLKLDAGSTTEFTDVLLVGEGKNIKIGTPMVTGAKVSATVLDEIKGDKVIAFKMKRRKGYHRTVGHRQKYARIRIDKILG